MSAPYIPSSDMVKRLAEEPLNTGARASKTWLPYGKQPAPRPAKPYLAADDPFVPAISGEEARQRRTDSVDKKLGAILTYYAGTAIPFDQIAAHTKLPLDRVVAAMKARGREA